MGNAPQLPTSTLKPVTKPYTRLSNTSNSWLRHIIEELQNRQFRCGDLVLRYASQPREQSKLSHKWEGPYRVKKVVGQSTYELEELDGKAVPRTWHASKLCKYYV
ncbi:hypothetical protein LIER_08439 [Lithospermum erythrorhizon]|uniref:Uncharacterized protein n=1 Tax=Lithospermum erythrorhizon TaxID=34254 RepID=A0AAV3PDY7_LITER